MAILKYTTADGQTVKINSYKVNNLVPVQSKGDNPNAVMSQKAVTEVADEIGVKIDEVTGQITALSSTVSTKANQSALDTLTQTVNGKANKSDVYTKTEADAKYLTASDITDFATKSTVNAVEAKADQAATDIQTINSDLTEIHNTLGDVATNDDLGELENVVSLKANTSALTAEVNRATAKETELNTAIGTKAASADLTAEITRAETAEGEISDRVEELENHRNIQCGQY